MEASSWSNHAKVSDADFDRLVRNVYKVLLTRGMVGTVLYSADAATRAAKRDLADVSARQARTMQPLTRQPPAPMT